MVRTNIENRLDEIQDEVLALASMVEKAITHAIDALRERDLEASMAVVAFDDVIDEKRFAIEESCVDLLATQQPAAGDLRWVIALLHIAVELERMGDYAEGIGKISLMMGDEPPLKPLIDIPRMAEMSIRHAPPKHRRAGDPGTQIWPERCARPMMTSMRSMSKSITNCSYL